MAYWDERWSGPNLGSLVRQVLGLTYAVFLMLPSLLSLQPGSRVACYAVAALIWLALATQLVVSVYRAGARIARLRSRPATLLALMAPLPLLLRLYPAYSFIILMLAFVVQVREYARGNRALFSLLAMAGVTLVAAIGMSAAENSQGPSGIDTFPDALLWALSELFRFGGVIDLHPNTEDGKVLGIVVILSGVLFAAVLISTFTSWLVAEDRQSAESNTSSNMEETVERAVRRALVVALGEDGLEKYEARAELDRTARRSVEGADVGVWVDMDRVLGHRPRAWRTSRKDLATEAMPRLLSRTAADWARIAGVEGRVVPHLVLEGGAREFRLTPEQEGSTEVKVERVSSADDFILLEAREGDVVITDGPRLVDKLSRPDEHRHVRVLGLAAIDSQ